MSTRVFVGNIPYTITEEELTEELANLSYGPASVRVIKDRETQQGRGFAFAEYLTPSDAAAAVKGLNGQMIRGRPVRADIATERQASGGKPGFGDKRSAHPGPPATPGRRHEKSGRNEDTWREERRSKGKRERW